MRDERFRALVRDSELRGNVTLPLEEEAAVRLGRAIGTYARRRAFDPRAIAIGRVSAERAAEVRDGLVAGLLQSGRDVVDVGVVAEGTLLRSTLALDVRGLLYVRAPDELEQCGLALVLDDAALANVELDALAQLAAEGRFSAGAGALSFADDRALAS